MLGSAMPECKFCCIFTVWLLSDCYPAVFQSAMLCQVTSLLQWKSNQANPLRSHSILSAAALHRQPSVTHAANVTHTHSELRDKYRDGQIHINHLLWTWHTHWGARGLGAKHGISSSYNGHTVWLTLHSDLSMEVTEMNFSLKDQ